MDGDGDSDVEDCEMDNWCNPACPRGADPDCEEIGCEPDGICNPACPPGADPDCGEDECFPDDWCNPRCPPGTDPDCEEDECFPDDWCNPRCPPGADPDCGEGECAPDDWCNPRCPPGADPDCGEGECGWDGWCNPECPEGEDPDCEEDFCGPDGWCNPWCGDADPDCEGVCGGVMQPCCTDGTESCYRELTCVEDEEEGYTVCLVTCEPSYCDYGDRRGFCYWAGWGDTGLCIDWEMTSVRCRPGAMNCRTEYGEREDTVCVEGEDWETYCVEFCETDPEACEEGYTCVPTPDGGACYPAG